MKERSPRCKKTYLVHRLESKAKELLLYSKRSGRCVFTCVECALDYSSQTEWLYVDSPLLVNRRWFDLLDLVILFPTASSLWHGSYWILPLFSLLPIDPKWLCADRRAGLLAFRHPTPLQKPPSRRLEGSRGEGEGRRSEGRGGFTFGRLQRGFKGASRLQGGLKGVSKGLQGGLKKASRGLEASKGLEGSLKPSALKGCFKGA